MSEDAPSIESATPSDLCSRAADLAAQFPRGKPVDVNPEAEIGTVMTSYWNVAIPRAAGLLAKALIVMASRQMTETVLIRRALMELYANLAVLNQSPTNAVRYSLEQFVSNERMLAKIQQHGIGTSDELAVKSAQLDESRAQLEAHGLNPDDVTRYEPFGMKTKDRFEAAGLPDAYYEVLYSIASDYAHMNARAVERVLDNDFGQREADAELAIATDFLIRILTSANEKLGTDLAGEIDQLKADFTAADAAVRAAKAAVEREGL